MIRKLGYSKNCRSIRALCFWFILFNISGSGKEMRNRFNGFNHTYRQRLNLHGPDTRLTAFKNLDCLFPVPSRPRSYRA